MSRRKGRRRKTSWKPAMPLWRRVFSFRFVVQTAVWGLALLLCVGILCSYWLHPYYEKAAGYDLSRIGSDAGENGGTKSPTSLDNVPQHLIDALVATEDSRFYHHLGFDPWGMGRAAFVNVQERRTAQGASTITQQLVRQTYGLRESTLERKLVEIFLAWRTERQFSKDEILEHYLNCVYFGDGYFGIRAASVGFFGKPPSELDLGESATLVGALKRPTDYNPRANPKRATEVRNHTLDRMFASGKLEKETRDREVAAPLAHVVHKKKTRG